MPKPTGAPPLMQHEHLTLVHGDDGSAAEYDTLAELFLGEIGPAVPPPALAPEHSAAATPLLSRPSPRRAAHTPPGDEPGPARTPVECLLLGHLPVLGSAWVSQYARCIAEEEDVTVALVQVRAGYATVEVIASDDDPAPQPRQARGSLEAAIEAAAAVAGRWILRVDEPDEPAVAASERVTSVTLLTSADEVAVVAAYRTLKGLLGSDGSAEGRSAERARAARVRVSVMGAPEDVARGVFAKLAEAARMFIHRPIERAPGVHRVSASRSSLVLFSGPAERAAQRAVEALAEADRRPRRGRGMSGESQARRTAVELPNPSEAPNADSASGHADVGQAASPGSPSALDAQQDTVSLAPHIPGLAPLTLACPYAREVQFGIDGQGRLHAMLWRQRDARTGLEPLTVAAAWASAHAELLAAVAPRLSAAAGPPVLHMFVDDPREVRRLLDAEIRVHLLAAAAVAGGTAWVCRDLN